jgi:hypothetical protein
LILALSSSCSKASVCWLLCISSVAPINPTHTITLLGTVIVPVIGTGIKMTKRHFIFIKMNL